MQNKILPNLTKIMLVLIALIFVLIPTLNSSQNSNISTDPKMISLIAEMDKTEDLRSLSDKAHSIGHELGASNSKLSIRELFALCGDPSYFFGACLHGELMALSDMVPIEELVVGCKKTEQDTRQYQNCAHAIGHIIIESKDIEPALKVCEDYFSDMDLSADCWSGVFMEYMLETHTKSMYPRMQYKASISIDCENVSSNYKKVCSGSIGSYTLYYPDSSIEMALSKCRSFTQEYRNYCILSAGNRLKSAPKNDQTKFCRLLNSNEISTTKLCDNKPI